MVDTWNTSARLQSIVQRFSGTRLQILHASNDRDIRSIHADMLFDAAVGGIAYNASAQIQAFKIGGSTKVRLLDPADNEKDGSDLQRTWIRRDLLQYGGQCDPRQYKSV